MLSGLVSWALLLEKRHFHRAAERAFRAALRRSPLGPDVEGVVFAGRRDLPGWLKRGKHDAAPVVITLNGEPIAQTLPNAKIVFRGIRPGDVEYVPFFRAVQGMWPYLGRGDTVQVEVDGSALPLIDGRYCVTGRAARQSRSSELRAMLTDGYVLAKGGKLALSLAVDRDWQVRAVTHAERISRLVMDAFGYRVFATYGVMLGAVREGNMIGHDSDFDMTYVSRYSERALVVGEFLEICRHLRGHGFVISNRGKRVVIRAADGTKLDLYFSWFAPDDTYRLSYGYHGPAVKRSEKFHQFEKYRLGAALIDLPANAEEQLTQLYGHDWRIPNPGFSHSRRTLKTEPAYFVGWWEWWRGRPSAAIRERLRWDRYYNSHAFEAESTFARSVDGYFSGTLRVLELGCGEGRDAIYFAKKGHRVVAVDRAAAGVAKAREKADRLSLADLEFSVCDITDRDLMYRIIAVASKATLGTAAPLVVYMRFLLHAIPLRDEIAILDLLADGASQPHYLAAEFRTDLDGGRFKAEGAHYRRFIPPDELRKRLETRGYAILHQEAGFGLSTYGSEDPHLGRIIARKG